MPANNRIQFRRGYSVGYAGSQIGDTPVTSQYIWKNDSSLYEGEIGYEIDTGKFKVGKYNSGGLMQWGDLPYAGGSVLTAESGIGLVFNSGTNSYSIYSVLSASSSGITVTDNNFNSINNSGTGKYYTIGLNNRLANFSQLSNSGIVVSTSTTGITTRSIVGTTNQININNNDGISGNPTIGLTDSVTITNNLTVGGNIIDSSGTILNEIINKLIPRKPPTFNNSGLTLSTTNTTNLLLCNGVSSANTNNNASFTVTGGQTIPRTTFTASYTNSLSNLNDISLNPSDTGTVRGFRNTLPVGTGTINSFPPSNNGTYGEIVISDNKDYSASLTTVASGFWQVFDMYMTGTTVSGWNVIYISGSNGAKTADLSWYYDSISAPTPTLTNGTVITGVVTTRLSSNVPHCDSGSTFISRFDASNLSGDTYPSTLCSVSPIGNAFGTVTTPTRTTAFGTDILPRNHTGIIIVTGTVNNSAFTTYTTASANWPTITVSNSRGSAGINPVPTFNVLVMGSSLGTTILREDNIPVGTTTQLGGSSVSGVRISGYPGNSETPASGTITVWNSNSTIDTTDATLVGGIIRHDVTNYSIGYVPAGPNYSSGRNGSQYFNLRFSRGSISKLVLVLNAPNGIQNIWFRLPGATSTQAGNPVNWDTDMSNSNGWATATSQYGGVFNNSNTGCAETTVVPINTAISNVSYTITFGVFNTSTSINNEVHVRIKLGAGQTITNLSFQGT